MNGLGNWVDVPLDRNTGEWVQDLDGTSWDEAPKPRRWHRCRPQTRGFIFGEYIERCACGGLHRPTYGLGWTERNSR